jgi:ribulose 1,5-bisphosphate synthetase/thiazole synthase
MNIKRWFLTATGAALAVTAGAILAPSTEAQRRHVTEPAKQVPIAYEADVVVAGGGMSGVFAAIAAARQGAKTVLIERYSTIGGTSGPGLNHGGGTQEIGPTTRVEDGYSKIWIYPEIAGIPKEFAERLEAMRSTESDKNRLGISHSVSFLATRMLREAGVEVLLSALVADPIMEGNTIKGVFVEHKSGREAITAKVVIDATGEADVARRAGAPILMPKESYQELDAHAPNGIGQFIFMGGIDWARYDRALSEKGADFEGTFKPLDISGIAQIVASKSSSKNTALNKVGELAAVKVQLARPHATVDAGNGWHWSKIDEAMRVYSHNLVMELRARVPGCENAYLVSLGEMGARGGPVIDGEYTMTMDDAMAGKRFDDVMYLYGEARVLKKTCIEDKKCVWPDVPYRVMVPKKIDGLLAVGRSAAGIPDTLLRNRTAIQHMGEVGGIAAAMAAKQGVSPRRLDVKALQRTLLKRGYYLGDTQRLAALGLAR